MKKTIIKLLLLMLAMLTSVPGKAYGFKSDGIYYNILSEKDRTVEVVSDRNTEYTGNIAIPKKVIYENKTYSVIGIGEKAFSGCKGLTNITIPGSVTSIGNHAFSGCEGLTNITIPGSVTSIDSRTFWGCSGLTSVTLPDGLKSIGDFAFSGCEGLTNITIPGSVTSIGTNAFYECSRLTSITIPGSVTSIEGAFENCFGLSSVTLSEGLTRIGKDAFRRCSRLTSVTLPDGLTSIDDGAFYSCTSLNSIIFPNSLIEIGYDAFSNTAFEMVKIPCLVTRCSAAFQNCSSLKQIDVDSDNANFASVDGALYNKDITTLYACPCAKEEIEIPNTVTTIGREAFLNCSKLSTIYLPSSVTAIEDYAFKGCKLKQLYIPNSVETIESGAFQSSLNWLEVESIYLNREIPLESSCSFINNVYKNSTLYVPVGTLAAYEKVDPWRNFWNIEEMAFSGIDEAEMDSEPKLQLSITNGSLTVSGIGSEEVIVVYDVHGHMLYSGNERTVSNLAPGMYIVKAANQTQKIVI